MKRTSFFRHPASWTVRTPPDLEPFGRLRVFGRRSRRQAKGLAISSTTPGWLRCRRRRRRGPIVCFCAYRLEYQRPETARLPCPSSSYYRTNNDFNIVMADWNRRSTTHVQHVEGGVLFASARLSRQRTAVSSPQVDILKDGSFSYTVFGTEANPYNNQLDTDIFRFRTTSR